MRSGKRRWLGCDPLLARDGSSTNGCRGGGLLAAVEGRNKGESVRGKPSTGKKVRPGLPSEWHVAKKYLFLIMVLVRGDQDPFPPRHGDQTPSRYLLVFNFFNNFLFCVFRVRARARVCEHARLHAHEVLLFIFNCL